MNTLAKNTPIERNPLATTEDVHNYLALVKELFQYSIDQGMFSWTGAHINLSFDVKHIFATYKKHDRSEDWLKNELRWTFLWVEEIQSYNKRKLSEKAYETSVDELVFWKDWVLQKRERKQRQKEEMESLFETINMILNLLSPTKNSTDMEKKIISTGILVDAILLKRAST